MVARSWIRAVLLAILLAAGPAADAGAQPLEGYHRQAREVIRELRGAMMQHLQTELQAAGPAKATQVCRHLAPQIETELEAETGWEVRRTALRVRNPDNAPTDLERGVLLSFQTRALAGQNLAEMESIRLIERNGRPTVHYMKAVPTFEPCLACHGDDLAPDVQAAIAAHYPDDQATGYHVGDLRGAFSLYKPFDPEQAQQLAKTDAAAAPALPERLPVGSDRYGDPRSGRDLFAQHCASCHSADTLAERSYAKADPDANLCRFLETHGLTDAARDCDIIAYLKALAQP